MNDPMVQWWRGFAHKVGLGNEQFSQAIGDYLISYADADQKRMDSEMARLGDGAKGRVEAVALWLDKNLPKEQSAAIKQAATNADLVVAIEQLIAKATGKSVINTDGNQLLPGKMTQEKLNQMMADPRYYDPMKRDPEFVRQVEAGFAQLYGGKTA